ncbi:mediator complex subunit [Podila epigama]|nr:mediator complex subunit [Podila epigama]
MNTWTLGHDVDSNVEAMSSADMLGLVYTMASARIRPVVSEGFVVQRLKDTQRIKNIEMDIVLLQFWLAALTGLAESNTSHQRLIWKSLVLVKIPSIVSQIYWNSSEASDFLVTYPYDRMVCEVVESALHQLSFYRGILNECDENIAEDGPTLPGSILKALANACQAKGLVRASELYIPVGDSASQLSLDDYNNMSIDMVEDLCGRALDDFEHQEKLVDKIIQTLDDNPLVLDLILLLRPPSALLIPLESYVNNLRQNEEDDIDTCNSNLEGFGIVLVLVMSIIRRYELANCLDTVLKDRNGFCHMWLLRTSSTIPPTSMSSMTSDMHALMGRWISALFDSMGISDDLIQTSQPQMLLEIAPSIFEQSLAACHAGVIDSTILTSGLDYFLQPCLLFVLIGVVQYLCEEIVFSTPTASLTSLSVATPGPGSSAGQSMMSPAGRVISPLASRGGKSGHGSQTSALMRLLRSEIAAALEILATENDHQVALIQERLAEATINYYPWSNCEPYEISKLAQQFSQSFSSIVSGGRSSLVAKREKGLSISGGSCYHVDIDLYRVSLTYNGPAQFVAFILEQVMEAGLTPQGKRAAVPGKLSTFQQGKIVALFIGMALDLFQSHTFLQHREQEQEHKRKQDRQVNGPEEMDIDKTTMDHSATSLEDKDIQRKKNSTDATQSCRMQLERDAAVEPFRLMLERRLVLLRPIAQDRPGFDGFLQGITHYQEQHPLMATFDTKRTP